MAGTPAGVSGVKTTSDLITSRKVQDVSDVIHMLEDDKKSLTTFLSKLGTRKVHRPDFTWLTDEILPKSGTIGTSAASAAASAESDLDLSGDTTACYLKTDDILKIPSTGEIIRVLETTANASAVSCARSINDTSTTIAASAQFVKIGNAREENSILRTASTLAANAVSTVEASATNYVQTFRDPVAMSRREMETKVFGPADRKHQRAKKLLEHAESIENALFHGVSAAEGTRTYTRGIIDMVPSGNTDAITTLTEDELDDFLMDNSRYFAGSSMRKVLAVSRFVHNTISAWAAPAQRINSPGSYSGWGVSVKRYLSGCGAEVDLLPCHALEGIPGTGSTPTNWDGYAVLIDMSKVKMAQFGDTYMKLAVDVQEADRDGVLDEYISDVGLEGGNLSHHGLITGVTG